MEQTTEFFDYPAMHLTATFTEKGIDMATRRSTPWLGGDGVNGQFVSGSSRTDGGMASLPGGQSRIGTEAVMALSEVQRNTIRYRYAIGVGS